LTNAGERVRLDSELFNKIKTAYLKAKADSEKTQA